MSSALSTAAFAEECGADLSLPLKTEKTGHLSAAVRLNGQVVRMLVDTGANVSTLDKVWASKLGAKVVGAEGVPVGEGRTELSVEIAEQNLGIQEFSVMNLQFINLPSQRYGTEPFAGQLGAAFFSQFKAKLYFGSNLMCLTANG